MKKNEIKTRRSKPPEVRTREQQEDQAFNKMLLWLAAAAVVEVVMVLINRYYIHTRVSELGIKMPLYKVLTVFPIAGIILFILFLFLAKKVRQEGRGKDGTLQVVMACGFLCMGLGGFALRNMEAAASPVVLAVVPGLGVLMMVFYLYQKEFFGCVLVGGMGLVGLWLYRIFQGGRVYYGYLILTLVVAVAGVVLALKLKGNNGVLKVGGKEVTLLQPGAAYLAYYLTAVVTVVLLLAPMALGTAVAYYAIWVMAAWLFILAVYFTSKLM